MGIELLGGPSEPFDVKRAARSVFALLSSTEEKLRRDNMRRRVQLYRDDFERLIEEQIGRIFDSPVVCERLYKLAKLAGYSSFLKRISDEVARPLYASQPTRRVYRRGERLPKRGAPQTTEREVLRRLAKSAGWDDAMGTVARLMVACSPAFICGRVVSGMGAVFDVVTGDACSVIPHPERTTRMLAFVYDRFFLRPDGTRLTTYVVVDDTRSFEIDSTGMLISAPKDHNLGRIPVVEVHAPGRWGSYWTTRGQDLESASLALMVIDAITLKKHKSQSHIQLAAAGDGVGTSKPKLQVLDEESLITVDGASSITSIDLQADPTGLHKTAEKIETTVAANYGISRDRLNQKSTAEQNAALNERTAEAAGVMVEVEADAFDLLCRLSSLLVPADRLVADEMRLSVDYRALSLRLDPKAERDLWNEDRSKGRRSALDDIYALNPEIDTDEEAWAELDKNMADEAVYVERRRALNIPEGATVEEPGQTPEQNGAMGPAVRDGKMKRDDAAVRAKEGPPPSGSAREGAILAALLEDDGDAA